MDNTTFKKMALEQPWDALKALTEKMTLSFTKYGKKVEYINPNANTSLSKEEKQLILPFYQSFKEDIELFCESKVKSDKDEYYKTLLALTIHFYIRDTRTIAAFLKNIEVNWEFEDNLAIMFEKMGFIVNKTGKDKDRKISLFYFSSLPDYSVTKNNKTFSVEVQQGYNNFLKQNKINTLLRTNAYLIFYSTQNKLFYLFNTEEIRQINNSESKQAYAGKDGKIFNLEDYLFTTLDQQLSKLGD